MRRFIPAVLALFLAFCGTPTDPSPSLRSLKAQNDPVTRVVSVPQAGAGVVSDVDTVIATAYKQSGVACLSCSIVFRVLTVDTSKATLLRTFVPAGGTGVRGAVVRLAKVGVAHLRAGNNGAADTTVYTIAAPPPPTGNTYFLADAEGGTACPPWSTWSCYGVYGGLVPVSSADIAKHGARSFKYEAVAPVLETHRSQTWSGNPQVAMPGGNGRYGPDGYYSTWLYLASGFDPSSGYGGWEMLLGWTTGSNGYPDPICHLGLENIGGKLQLSFYLKNASPEAYAVTHLTPPPIPGYTLVGGDYRMSTGSPAGIVPFPRGRWVHLAAFYHGSKTNGHVIVWQDGVKIMDLTAPAMDTFDGNQYFAGTGSYEIQFGYYGAASNGPGVMYADDFKVTDYLTSPTNP